MKGKNYELGKGKKMVRKMFEELNSSIEKRKWNIIMCGENDVNESERKNYKLGKWKNFGQGNV